MVIKSHSLICVNLINVLVAEGLMTNRGQFIRSTEASATVGPHTRHARGKKREK